MYIDLPKEKIDEIFTQIELRNPDLVGEDEPHQVHALVALYRIAYPDWSKIASVDGWPTVTKKTNEYIFRKFMDFDDKHHKDVLRGGLWMNNGFSTEQIAPDLKDWQIDPSTGICFYKEEGEK